MKMAIQFVKRSMAMLIWNALLKQRRASEMYLKQLQKLHLRPRKGKRRVNAVYCKMVELVPQNFALNNVI